MKLIVLATLIIFYSSGGYAQLQLGPGTNWRSNNTTYVVLNNIGLQYNTSTQVIDNIFKFTGDNNAAISGNSLPVLSTIQVAKTGAGKILLQNDINIYQSVTFQSGEFDLGNNYVNLGTNASVSGENDNTHFISTGTGEVAIMADINNPFLGVNPGNLGARITTTANLGITFIRRGHRSQSSNGTGSSILRYFTITPTNNTGLNATLRISYLNSEVNGLSEPNLVMWRSENNVNWQNVGFSNRNAIQNFVEQTSINSFSRWTLSTPGSALPLIWGGLAAACAGNKITISWKTLQELNTATFTIQRSTNAIAWENIGTITAAGTSTSTRSYQFDDINPGNGVNYYRIHQTDIDGKCSYSSVLKTNCNDKKAISIYPTLVQNNLNISVPYNNEIKKMQFNLYDPAGKQVMSKELTWQTQQISIGFLSSGMYMTEIRYGNKKFQSKIIKQ